MNTKKLIIAIVLTFLVANLMGFLIHAVLLVPDYMSVKHLYRSEGAEKLLWINVAYLAFAIGATWIYAKGVEAGRPWLGQGLRFGLAIWLVLAVPSFLIAYSVQPMPMSLTMKQIGYELIDKLLIGVVIAAIYRKP